MKSSHPDKGNLCRVNCDTQCAHDVHEVTNYPREEYVSKPMIPGNTVVIFQEEWCNMYGVYWKVEYNGKIYDVEKYKFS